MAKRKVRPGMPTVVASYRDVGKLGYGSGGDADSPWTRQGIFVMGGTGSGNSRGVNTGGPGINPARRPKVENSGLKTKHDYIDASGLCLKCHMLREGHDRQMARLA